jgi:hypothetical protein
MALVYIATFATTCTVFLMSPVRQMADSRYTLLVCEALLRDGSLRLDRFFEPPLDPMRFPDLEGTRLPYPIEQRGSHLYSFFPPGTPVLTLPLYAVLRPFGFGAVDDKGRYDFQQEERAQGVLAAIVTAGLTVVLLAMARTLLPLRWSLLVALGSAFGTPMWSTASRALWSDTWGIALLGLALLLLLRAETVGRRPNLPLLATLLAWTFFVKPTYAIPIAAISVLVLRRGRCLAYVTVGLGWLLVFLAFAWSLYRGPLPTYYATRELAWEVFWPSLSGSLASPSRGLLTCVPVMCFVAYLAPHGLRRLAVPGLAIVAAASVGGYLLLLAFFPIWWAGHCFGARHMTALVPWFALLAVLGLHATRDERGGGPRLGSLEALAGAALLSLSVAIQARGAILADTSAWNYSPNDVDLHPKRLWDWSHPQALAGLVPPVYEVGTTILPADPSSDLFLRAGFGGRGEDSRRTIASRAELWFDVDGPGPATLRVDLEPLPVSSTPQRVIVELNGRPLATLNLDPPERAAHDIPLPTGTLARRNRLTLLLPDAVDTPDPGTPAPIQLAIRLFGVRIVSDSRPGRSLAR